MLKHFAFLFLLLLVLVSCLQNSKQRPNILFAISDDQSYPHAGAYRYNVISAPGFDRIANEGILFANAFSVVQGNRFLPEGTSGNRRCLRLSLLN